MTWSGQAGAGVLAGLGCQSDQSEGDFVRVGVYSAVCRPRAGAGAGAVFDLWWGALRWRVGDQRVGWGVCGRTGQQDGAVAPFGEGVGAGEWGHICGAGGTAGCDAARVMA